MKARNKGNKQQNCLMEDRKGKKVSISERLGVSCYGTIRIDLNSRTWERQEDLILRPTWSIYQVLEQSGLPREPLSQKGGGG